MKSSIPTSNWYISVSFQSFFKKSTEYQMSYPKVLFSVCFEGRGVPESIIRNPWNLGFSQNENQKINPENSTYGAWRRWTCKKFDKNRFIVLIDAECSKYSKSVDKLIKKRTFFFFRAHLLEKKKKKSHIFRGLSWCGIPVAYIFRAFTYTIVV